MFILGILPQTNPNPIIIFVNQNNLDRKKIDAQFTRDTIMHVFP